MNTLEEMEAQNDKIYSVKGRVKAIEGVLRKVSKKLHDGKSISSYSDACKYVDDIVGARVLAYLSDSMEDLHKAMTSFDRFELLTVTIHDQRYDRFYYQFAERLQSEEKASTGIFSSRINRKIKLEIRLNEGGYAGFHYVFRPRPVDPVWISNPGSMYPKFEIQVRTILQEAWSEVSHNLVYKPTDPENENRSLALNLLSSILRACDTAMSNVAIDRPIKPRKKK